MRPISFIAIAVIAASQVMNAGSIQAQGQPVSSDILPAEFPPASYTGRQYVDSRGCVFIRAGVDGNVNWVPRVARDRTVICGFQPSLSQVATSAPAAQPETSEEPPAAARTQIATSAPAVTPAPAPAPRPATTATQQPAAQPSSATALSQTQGMRPQPAPAATQPEPAATQTRQVRVVSAVPTTVERPETMAPRQNTCRWASAISEQYMRAPSGVTVRCGPQASSHVTMVSGSNSGRSVTMANPAPTTEMIRQASANRQAVPLRRSEATVAITRDTRVVPRSVYENQVASTRGVHVPEGYETVWDDDRLNTKRAHQTVGGMADTQLVWTNTVPRVLVERETGKQVTHLHPDLIYPYTSYAQQQAAHATVSTRGTVRRDTSVWGRSQRDARNRPHVAHASAPLIAGISATADASVTAASRATSVARVAKQAPTHRYVQVGVFADPDHARREAQRIANSGLPSKLGNLTRSGTTYGVVISGPFGSQAQLEAALRRVRGMGFGSASLRR